MGAPFSFETLVVPIGTCFEPLKTKPEAHMDDQALNRIAEALERMVPAPLAAPDFAAR